MICRISAPACPTETEGGAYAGCQRRRWWPAAPPVGGPPISGTRGSGTVFFSGCSLGCVFCQNDAISHQDLEAHLPGAAAGHLLRAYRPGAHNINLVNPPTTPSGGRLLAQPCRCRWCGTRRL